MLLQRAPLTAGIARCSQTLYPSWRVCLAAEEEEPEPEKEAQPTPEQLAAARAKAAKEAADAAEAARLAEQQLSRKVGHTT